MGGRVIIWKIEPLPKPRLTRRGKFSAKAKRYYAYAEQLRLLALEHSFEMPANSYRLEFWLTMPKSWSVKKKREMFNQPHQSRPDKDNLEKAFLDALCDNDSYIWDGRVTKRWGLFGLIRITTGIDYDLDEIKNQGLKTAGL